MTIRLNSDPIIPNVNPAIAIPDLLPFFIDMIERTTAEIEQGIQQNTPTIPVTKDAIANPLPTF